MGIRTGTPTLKLNRLNKFSKNSGNAESIIKEMLEDENGIRWSADKNYDPKLTKNNIVIEGFTNSKDAVDFVYNQAENYVKIDKNGNQRKLRSDAVIAMAGIIKPDLESMEKMSEREQLIYLKAHWDEQKKVLEESGIEILSAVIHRDEMNPHIHYLGYDPEYRLGKKVDIKLFRRFNKEIPERLQEKGYDVEVLERYNPDEARAMSPDEKEQYKSKILQEKKLARKNAQPSNVFKAQKTAENIIINANKRAKQKELEAEEKVSEKLDEVERYTNEKIRETIQRDRAIEAARRALNDDRRAFAKEKAEWHSSVEKARKEHLKVTKTLEQAMNTLERVERMEQWYGRATSKRVDEAVWDWLNNKGGIVERLKQGGIVPESFDVKRSFDSYQNKKKAKLKEQAAETRKRTNRLMSNADYINSTKQAEDSGYGLGR